MLQVELAISRERGLSKRLPDYWFAGFKFSYTPTHISKEIHNQGLWKIEIHSIPTKGRYNKPIMLFLAIVPDFIHTAWIKI